VPVLMFIKALVIYGACRAFGSTHNNSVQIAGLLPQGGEFGFVIFSAAAAAGVFEQSTASLLVAIVTISMALTPLAALLANRLMQEAARADGRGFRRRRFRRADGRLFALLARSPRRSCLPAARM
jgi:CPA2 family monovalent cation:H+ antiporter-2